MDRRPGSDDMLAEYEQDRIDAARERSFLEEPEEDEEPEEGALPEGWTPADDYAEEAVTTPARLSTCGRCGGTIERRPGSAAGWGHLAETARNADGHLPDPDDSYRAGPGEEE